MKRKAALITIAMVALLIMSSVVLASSGKKWNDHKEPWDFLFNDIMLDMHHEFQGIGQLNDDGYYEKIKGFMYITYNDEGNAILGTDVVGWQVHGKFSMAQFNGVMAKHPWTVYEDDVPKEQGYVHWHPLDGHQSKEEMEWYPGYFLKHSAVESFYFLPQNRMVYPGIDYDFHNNYNTIK